MSAEPAIRFWDHLWEQPAGSAPRGTVVVLPGRGEHAAVYERLGRRLAFDGYRVLAVDDAARAAFDLPEPMAAAGPGPRVLLGADTGAHQAITLAAAGTPGLDGLILAGLPTTGTGATAEDWEAELDLRSTCPHHRLRLTRDRRFRRGVLAAPAAEGAAQGPALDRVTVPVLALHGVHDVVSPLSEARRVYSGFPGVHLVTLAGTRHDVLNDITHRTAAATVVLFLEQLRLSPELPAIAVSDTGYLTGGVH
ncbi:alpha/beta hydrolase [Streptomyces sp. SBT349]|uniref:alpha/beta hydrolase n=1 Tax=Streptomyces sp. SBT349 TaxID=1580539 RepID=UPI00066DD91A|nr:alpha/beta hydrolase [Streptomyces sp. SBT349]